MGLCRLLEKGLTEGNTGNRPPVRLPPWPAGTFLCRGGKASDSGQGEQFHAAPWKEARCLNPACRASSPARLKSRPTSSGLWASELMVRGIPASAAIFRNCPSGYCSPHLLCQPAVLSSRQAPVSRMASSDGS